MSFRVWEREWVAVYTSERNGMLGEVECRAFFQGLYDDRVQENEWRIDNWGEEWPATLMLLVPIVKGEFRLHTDAESFKSGSLRSRTAVVAELNTPLDQEQADYAKRKLPT